MRCNSNENACGGVIHGYGVEPHETADCYLVTNPSPGESWAEHCDYANSIMNVWVLETHTGTATACPTGSTSTAGATSAADCTAEAGYYMAEDGCPTRTDGGGSVYQSAEGCYIMGCYGSRHVDYLNSGTQNMVDGTTMSMNSWSQFPGGSTQSMNSAMQQCDEYEGSGNSAKCYGMFAWGSDPMSWFLENGPDTSWPSWYAVFGPQSDTFIEYNGDSSTNGANCVIHSSTTGTGGTVFLRLALGLPEFNQCPAGTTSTAGATSIADCVVQTCTNGQEDLRRFTDSEVIFSPGTNLARTCGASFDEGCPTAGLNNEGSSGLPSAAVDGYTEMIFSSHYSGTRWWAVDLGRDYYVTDLVYYAADWVTSRTDDIYLRIGTSEQGDLSSSGINSATLCGGEINGQTVASQKYTRSCPADSIARYVYVNGGVDRLYVGELEVYGYGGESPAADLTVCQACAGNEHVNPPSTRCVVTCSAGSYGAGGVDCTTCPANSDSSTGTNLARACGVGLNEACTVIASSSDNTNLPEKIVDGTSWSSSAGLWHSANNGKVKQWARIDLGQIMEISYLHVYNRENYNAGRLHQSYLRTSTTAYSTWDDIHANAHLCGQLTAASSGDECWQDCIVMCDTVGRYVYILQHESKNDHYALTELEVFGDYGILSRTDMSSCVCDADYTGALGLNYCAGDACVASASSHHSTYYPAGAIDGEISQAQADSFHTASSGSNQYLQIDLQSAQPLAFIRIYNWVGHEVACPRIEGAKVYVSDLSVIASGTSWDSMHLCGTISSPAECVNTPYIDILCPGATGRYVVVRGGSEYLNIYELEVYTGCSPPSCSAGSYGIGGSSCDSCPANSDSPTATESTVISSCVCNAGYVRSNYCAADACVASASSYHTTYYPAGAIDGVKDSSAQADSFVTASTGNGQYLQIDLQSAQPIEFFRIYNWVVHHLACPRIDGAKVYVSDTAVTSTPWDSMHLCATIPSPADCQNTPYIDIECPGVTGRYVVLRSSSDYLNIYELEVYTDCIPCGTSNGNTYENAGVCQACNGNAIANLAEGAHYCLCNAGYYATGFDSAGDNCSPCAVGDYSLSPSIDTTCESCPGGDTTSAEGSDELVDCECIPGYFYSDAAVTYECDPCIEGTYQGSQGQSHCESCGTGGTTLQHASTAPAQCVANAGYTGPDGGSFSACESGTYKADSGSASCLSCPNAATSPAGSILSTDCVCNSGYSGADGATCTECGAGYFEDVATNACMECWRDSDNSFILANSFRGLVTSATSGSTDCLDCVSNAQPISGQNQCECNAGYFEELDGRHYSSFDDGNIDMRGSVCTACPVNTYKSTSGNLICSSDETYDDGYGDNCDGPLSEGKKNVQDFASWNLNYWGWTDSLERCCLMSSMSDSNFNYGYGIGNSQHTLMSSSMTRWVASQCTSCPANSYHALTGQTSADACACNAGYTGTGGVCVACAAGKYKIETGSGACTDCNTDSNSPEGSTVASECACNVGYTGPDGGTCDACLAGKYKANTGSDDCGECAGNSNSPAASDASTDCTCNAGYTGPDGGTCEACAAGKYKIDSGSAACGDCDGNADSLGGSTVATACQCNAGYTGPNGGVCSVCGENTFKTSAGPDDCETCPENSFNSNLAQTAATACLCNAGYSGPDGGACTACEVDQYKTGTGSAACDDCHGDANSLAGSTSNTDCSCNSGYIGDGHTECTQCGAGTYVEDNFCKTCPGNSNSDAGSTAVTDCLCNAGYQGPAGGLCENCPVNSFCVGGSDQNTCLDFSNSPLNSDSIDDCTCNAGYTGPDGGSCGDCTADSYCTGGTATEACPSNSNSPANSDEQTDCTCNAGYMGPAGGTCADCAVGSYCEGGSATEECPGNSHSPANSDEVTDCICNAGYTGPDGQACTACEVNHYKSATGSADCLECTEFSTSSAASIAQTACVCDAGYVGPPGGPCGFVCPAGSQRTPANDACEMCPASKYKPDAGDHDCTDCPEDALHSLTNQTSVTACFCEHGFIKHSNWPSTAECVNCYQGKFSQKFNNYNGEGVCFDCDVNSDGKTCASLAVAPAGYNYDGSNLALCTLNTYNDGNFQTCQTCPEGSSHALNGSESINDCTCHVGYTRPNSGQACEQCVAGTYKDATGDGACSDCPSDSSSVIGSDAVGDCHCNAGYTGPNGGTCVACVANSFKASSGPSTCTSCPANTVSVSGSTDASDCKCDVGYTGPDGGACTACLEGTYKDKNGTAECSNCVNHASSPSGSDNIDDCTCNPGYNFDALNNCVLDCAVGETGSGGSCGPCEAGTYKSTTGSGECTSCPTPTVASASGSASLTDCVCLGGQMGMSVNAHKVISAVGNLNGDISSVEQEPAEHIFTTNMPSKNIHLSGQSTETTATITRHGVSILVFQCEERDCIDTTVDLHGIISTVSISGTTGTSMLTSYSTREITADGQTYTDAKWLNARVGDYLFLKSDLFGTAVCAQCVPGAKCVSI